MCRFANTYITELCICYSCMRTQSRHSTTARHHTIQKYTTRECTHLAQMNSPQMQGRDRCWSHILLPHTAPAAMQRVDDKFAFGCSQISCKVSILRIVPPQLCPALKPTRKNESSIFCLIWRGACRLAAATERKGACAGRRLFLVATCL